MGEDPSDVEFAETQILEARRRLDSVEDRIIVENERPGVTMVVDHEDQEPLQPHSDHLPEDWEEKDRYELVRTSPEVVVREKYEEHIQNILIDCQLCIEMSAKAMFKLVGLEHPFKHGISLNDRSSRGFLQIMSEKHGKRMEAARVLFLTQFWSEFYELAKYGAPELNLRPDGLFEENDAERAFEDASYCVVQAEELLEEVK